MNCLNINNSREGCGPSEPYTIVLPDLKLTLKTDLAWSGADGEVGPRAPARCRSRPDCQGGGAALPGERALPGAHKCGPPIFILNLSLHFGATNRLTRLSNHFWHTYQGTKLSSLYLDKDGCPVLVQLLVLPVQDSVYRLHKLPADHGIYHRRLFLLIWQPRAACNSFVLHRCKSYSKGFNQKLKESVYLLYQELKMQYAGGSAVPM